LTQSCQRKAVIYFIVCEDKEGLKLFVVEFHYVRC
jgi:hypothetical protein